MSHEANVIIDEMKMDTEEEWCVLLGDGAEVYVWADDEPGAMQEAIERGYYQPVSAELVQP